METPELTDIARRIADALEGEGLLASTLNGSDTPRREATEVIARHLRDLVTLCDYWQQKYISISDSVGGGAPQP